MEEKRTKPKITNEEALTELIKNTFAELEIKKNQFGETEITRKGNHKRVRFAFQDFFGVSANYIDEQFVDHICLSFSVTNGDGGAGWLKVADDEDLTPQIIDFIDNQLDHPKRRYEVNEQLSLF